MEVRSRDIVSLTVTDSGNTPTIRTLSSKRKMWPIAGLAFALVCSLALMASTKACNNAGHVTLAKVDGQIVYDSDLEKSAGKALSEQRERLYRLQKQKLEEYINAVLLTQEAKRNGVTVASLLDRNVYSKIMPVGDDEIEAFYRLNQSRLGVDLRQAREQIREFLRSQKSQAQMALYVKSLSSKAKIETYLKAPPRFRAQVPTGGAPFQGPENAPVTIVTFEDYQCPFCKQVQPMFAKLLSRYGGRVRLVHKDFPMDVIHPQARQAAEAGRCADRQGKFWRFHDILYANSPKAGPENLRSFAQQAGLDVNSFEECVKNGEFKSAVQRDTTEAAQLGITGTPTFFINGREMTGVQPFTALQSVIEEELNRS
jgi:protein-disulfide isomerase